MNVPYPHDTIRFSAKTKEQIFEVCDPLYVAGCSLRDIEAKTGFRKTSIMHALKLNGRALRSPTGGPKQRGSASVGRRSSGRPYGYDWIDGVLVMDPKEYRVVQKILSLWRDGQSARAISRELNRQGVPAQRSKKWSHGLVISIVERNKSKNVISPQHQRRNRSAK